MRFQGSEDRASGAGGTETLQTACRRGVSIARFAGFDADGRFLGADWRMVATA